MPLNDEVEKAITYQKEWLTKRYPDLPTTTITELAHMMVAQVAYAHRKGYVDGIRDMEAANGKDETD